MDVLPGLWSLTPIPALIGMVVFLYWSFATGRIITKNSHEREIEIYKEVSATKDKTIERQAQQIDSLLEVGRTTEAFLKAVGPPRGHSPSGGEQ